MKKLSFFGSKYCSLGIINKMITKKMEDLPLSYSFLIEFSYLHMWLRVRVWREVNNLKCPRFFPFFHNVHVYIIWKDIFWKDISSKHSLDCTFLQRRKVGEISSRIFSKAHFLLLTFISQLYHEYTSQQVILYELYSY
jgi:hypothetical protein